MPKAEWGVKRICLSCGVRFYDLQRSPVFCPACGAEVDVTAMVKPKRIRSGVSEKAVAPKTAIDGDELIDEEDEELTEEEELDEELIDEEATPAVASGDDDDDDDDDDVEEAVVEVDEEEVETFDDDVLLEEDEDDDDIEDVAPDDIVKL